MNTGILNSLVAIRRIRAGLSRPRIAAIATACLALTALQLHAQDGSSRRMTRAGAPSQSAVQRIPAELEEDLPPGLEPKRLPVDVPIDDPPRAGRGTTADGFSPEQLLSPGGLSSTLRLVMLMTVLSIVPSVLMMTTCFARFAIVLGLLRQALGTPQLPPNQLLMALSLFLTFFVMSPVWQRSYNDGIRPYTERAELAESPTLGETFEKSVAPVRRFMSEQIDLAGNSDTVWMLLEYQRSASGATPGEAEPAPSYFEDVPLPVLLSSYLLSELKVGFLIGFRILLPFLVLDLVVAAVLATLGLTTVSSSMVSLPFKLLLFVLIDGWTLTVGMMLASVHP